jgi:hypothetical protein
MLAASMRLVIATRKEIPHACDIGDLYEGDIGMLRDTEAIPSKGWKNNPSQPFQRYPTSCTQCADPEIVERAKPAFLLSKRRCERSEEKRPQGKVETEIQNQQDISRPGERGEPIRADAKKNEPARIAQARRPEPAPLSAGGQNQIAQTNGPRATQHKSPNSNGG